MSDTLARSTEPAPSAASRGTEPTRPPPEALAVVGLAVMAAVGAATAGATPTTSPWFDPAVAAVVGAALVVVAERASRSAWLWLAGVTAAAAAGQPVLLAIAAVGLVVAFIASVRPARPPLIGAVVMTIDVVVLFRLDMGGPRVAATAIAAIAIAPLLVSAYRRAATDTRRVARRVVIGAGAVLGVVVVAGGVAIGIGLRQIDEAIDAANLGMAAAREGDREGARGSLGEARDLFERAHDSTTAVWTRPLAAVPVVGQHLDALDIATDEGAALTGAAADAADVAAVGDLTVQGGRVDLGAVDDLAGPMAMTASQAASADDAVDQLDSPWLLPPFRTMLDRYADELDGARREADLAVATLNAAPRLLGAGRTTRYLVLFASPSEARELGGFLGNYGELEATDGDLTLATTGRAEEDLNTLAAAVPAALADPASLPERYLAYEPGANWQNITGTPDFPAVARVAGELYGKITGRPVDGVLYLDPYALAGLLELTGPIQVDDLGRPLNAQNAAAFLLRDQYLDVPDKAARIDFLEEASRLAFERLTTGDLPGVGRVSNVLDPLVDQRRLQAYSFDPEIQRLFERLGLTGALPAPDEGDLLAVVHANANPNKLDAYLRREVDYHVDVDPGTGQLESTATVRLHNDAPAAGLPDYVLGNRQGLPPGTNRLWLSIYSPLRLREAALDGQPLGIERHDEYGLHRYGAFVAVPPGGSVTVTYALAGRIAAGDYRLVLPAQPLVNADRFSLGVTAPEGWRIEGDQPLEPFDLDQDRRVRLSFTGPDG